MIAEKAKNTHRTNTSTGKEKVYSVNPYLFDLNETSESNSMKTHTNQTQPDVAI